MPEPGGPGPGDGTAIDVGPGVEGPFDPSLTEGGPNDTLGLANDGISSGEPGDAGAPACSEGATTCKGVDQRLVCTAGAFAPVETCGSICRIGADGQAECAGSCIPESRTCLVDDTPAVCGAGGEFEPGLPCGPEAPRCLDGVCVVCIPGDKRCSDTRVPETCAEGGEAWVPAPEGACGGTTPACLPETGLCAQCNPGVTRACTEEVGNCAAGTQLCGDDATWGACSVQPGVDSCVPGDDASCDGKPNGGCACTLPVPCGPRAAVGSCRQGTSACVNGKPADCQGAVFPAARDCTSTADKDCNGVADNTTDNTCQCAPGTSSPCGRHPQDGVGICRAGSQACVAAAGNASTSFAACQNSVGPRARDCGSNLDNDCNGVADNATDNTCQCAPGTRGTCGRHPQDGVGICHAGSQACLAAAGNASTSFGACQDSVGPRARDCRSNLDNDCNGVADNTTDNTCQCAPATSRACDQHPQDGVGICRAGSQLCVAAAGNASTSFAACQGAVAPRARDCRSTADNDCNGVADNVVGGVCQCVPGATQDCGIEPGSQGCSRGRQTCVASANGASSSFGACVFADVTAGTECNDANAATIGDSCRSGSCVGARLGTLATGGTTNGGCVVRSGGAVYCFNGAHFGANGLTGNAPVLVTTGMASVAVGTSHACAFDGSGNMSCWGDNGTGTLGNGTTNPVAGLAFLGFTLPFVREAMGTTVNTAALTVAGTVFVWGGYSINQPALFGPSAPVLEPFIEEPFQVTGLSPAAHLALGGYHACVVLNNGTVSCWGFNDAAQLGRAPTSNADTSPTPALVADTDGSGNIDDAVGIASGESYTCVVRSHGGGTVTCWGSLFGVDGGFRQAPAELSNLTGVVQVTVNNSSACALRRNGTVACWGENGSGQLGNGSTVSSTTPVAVSNLCDTQLLGNSSPFGSRRFCALCRNNSVSCWGPTQTTIQGLPL